MKYEIDEGLLLAIDAYLKEQKFKVEKVMQDYQYDKINGFLNVLHNPNMVKKIKEFKGKGGK